MHIFDKSPLILAPMAELSHAGMRTLIHRYGGCDLYFSEMISASALAAGTSFEPYYVETAPEPEKLVFQLVGSEPELLTAGAGILCQFPVYGIDINMGCSAPHIAKTGAGIAWMKSLDSTRALAASMRKAAGDKSFSVKLRTGYDDNFDYLFDFCRALEQEGVDFITLHARTKGQKFTRRAKWDYIGELKKELKLPVVGNGDITDWDSFKWRRQFGADGYMIGRGAVKRPWIFALLKGKLDDPDFSMEINQKQCCDDYIQLLEQYQPEEFWPTRMRRFLNTFYPNLTFGGNLWRKLQNCEDYSVMVKEIREYFVRNPGEEIKPCRS